MSTQPTLPTGPCPRQPDRAGRPAVSARITITDEMIEKGREAREEHYLRVSPVSCTCGWRSDTYIEADGLPRYEAHLVELALEAAAPLVAAQALRDAADEMEAMLGEHGPGNRNTGYGQAGLALLARIRARADQTKEDR